MLETISNNKASFNEPPSSLNEDLKKLKAKELQASQTINPFILNPLVTTVSSCKSELKSEPISSTQSFSSRVSEWFWGVFGIRTNPKPSPIEVNDNLAKSNYEMIKDRPPRLSRPDSFTNNQLAQAASDFNRHYKNMLESEEGNIHKNLDTFLYMIVRLSLNQKELKEENGIQRQQDILKRNKEIIDLNKAYFDKKELTLSGDKWQTVFRWIDLGLVATTVACIGATLSGAVVALPAAISSATALVSGAFSSANAYFKHKHERTKGELSLVELEKDHQAKQIKNELDVLGFVNKDVTSIHKLIIEQLKLQNQALRDCFSKA